MRHPDGAQARTHSITSRMTTPQVAALDRQHTYRGFPDRSAYIRWLIEQDGKQIAREQRPLQSIQFPPEQRYEFP